MKQVIALITLISIVACKNINKNTLVENHQNSKMIAIDATSTSKSSSVLHEHEIIGGWLKESTKQQVVLDKLGLPKRKGEDEF